MRQATLITDHAASFTGLLTADGQARLKQMDREGHMVPVLMLELESESALHMPLHIEQPFPADQMRQAEAAARRYRKGQRITVQAPVLSVRMAVVASHIHTHPTDPKDPAE
ncbi:MAG: hypothetical protein AB7I35_01475 [Ramlibacter sp.]